jgi:uncharacterized protein DUF4345
MSPTFVKWAPLVAGVLTLTMVYAAIAPQAAVRSTFGETLEGPVAEIIIRNWGALIALIGAMLIYAAFDPAVRPLELTVDSVMIVLFAVCLAKGTRKVIAA